MRIPAPARRHAVLLAALLGGAACGAETSIFQAIDDCLREQRLDPLADRPVAAGELDRPDALGRTPLTYLVVQAGEAEADAARLACATQVAELLIRRGADPERGDRDGSRPLHLALADGDGALARCLLAHGAQAEAPDGKGRTPLLVELGTLFPQPDLVMALLRSGARAEPVDGRSRQPAPLAVAILARIKAIEDQRQGVAAVFDGPEPAARAAAALAIVAALLDAQARPGVLIPGPSGFAWPALHAAVRAGDLDLARLLVAHGAEISGTADNGLGLIGCAVDSGRPDLIAFLAAAGAPVDELDARGNPVASRVEDADMLAALLEAGVAPDTRRADRRTLLHLAAEADNAEVIATLLDHGAAPDPLLDPPPKSDAGAPAGWLVGRTPLWLALAGHHPRAVLALLRRGAAVRVRQADGTTTLHLAATWSGPLGGDEVAAPGGAHADAAWLVRLLVAEGGDPNARTAKPASGRAAWGRTPLHAACQAGSLDAADALLALGADPTLIDSAGCAPWQLALGGPRRADWVARFAAAGVAIDAARLRSLDLRQALAAGDGLRARALIAADPALAALALGGPGDDPDTATPLHLAIAMRDRELVGLLIDQGAGLGVYDGRGRLPLHRAIETNQPDVAKLLVEHGAAPDAAVRAEGEAVTPLLIALGRFPGGTPIRDPVQQLAMATALLDLGADPDRASGKDHCPLEVAVAAGNLAAVQLLLGRGAKAGFRDGSGRSLLHLLAWGSQRGLEIADLLVARGVDPDGADLQRQETPLHRVARSGRALAVRWLLAHGASAARTDARRWTPLHAAAEAGNLSALDELVDGGASLDAPDRDGATPLAVAVEAGQGDAVARLLERHAGGADTDAATVRGWGHLKQGQHYKLQALLEHDPAIASGRLIRGETLLMRAADRQDAIAVRLLLGHQADPDAQDDQGRTPLMHAALAVAGDDLAVVEALLAAGCDPGRADRAGATVLDLATAQRAAIDRRHPGCARKLLDLLARAGARPGRGAVPAGR